MWYRRFEFRADWSRCDRARSVRQISAPDQCPVTESRFASDFDATTQISRAMRGARAQNCRLRSVFHAQQERVYRMKFSSFYPHYVAKAEKKGRTRDDVDDIICWLTGYTRAGLITQIAQGVNFETFFAESSALNPKRELITGVVCGVRVENVTPLSRVGTTCADQRMV